MAEFRSDDCGTWIGYHRYYASHSGSCWSDWTLRWALSPRRKSVASEAGTRPPHDLPCSCRWAADSALGLDVPRVELLVHFHHGVVGDRVDQEGHIGYTYGRNVVRRQ
jgi:hypothetical protein